MKVARGRGEHVLYLDFDGVLHHDDARWHPRRGVYLAAPGEFTLFQHAERLEALLAPYPSVRIVLSTSWVRVLGYSRARKRLPPGLRERVIGATYHSSMHERAFAMLPRGVQVLDDVARRQPRDWVKPHDLVVAGKRFGHGNPHIQGFLGLKGAGVGLLVESMGRGPLRACVNAGVPVLQAPGLRGLCRAGDELEVDFEVGVIRNLRTDTTLQAEPMHAVMCEIVAAGGGLAHMMQRLGERTRQRGPCA